MNPESNLGGASNNESEEILAKRERLAELKKLIADAVSAKAYNNANASRISTEADAAWQEDYDGLVKEHDELEAELNGERE